MDSSLDEELSGYLHLKVNTGHSKIKSGKKWFVLNNKSNQLDSFKNPRDVRSKTPLESLQLYGAGVSYGNSEENEFIVNIRGAEFCLSAENHKLMMRWINVLQKQVKIKPVATDEVLFQPKLEIVSEEEPLELEQENEIVTERKPKRMNFFQRFFSQRFRFRSNSKKEATHRQLTEEKRTVQAAHLRSVVGSMQDITTKPVSCNNCKLLEGRHSYLNEQVLKLNEDVENVKDELRVSVRKVHQFEKDIMSVKRDYIDFIQKSAMQEDDTFVGMDSIPCFKQVLDLLKSEVETNNNLPTVTCDGFAEPHEDYLGFIHGNYESPLQLLLYLCQLLKRRFTTSLQGVDEIYQQWHSFTATIATQPIIQDNNMLQDLVVSGIPHEVRGTLWKWLISWHVKPIKDVEGEDYYTKLVKRLPKLQGAEDDDNDSSIEKQIKIDLLRTMPTHKDYQSLDEGKIPTLHRILRALLIHNSDVGYCQGMNFMVGFALMYLDEESCFWLLVSITELLFSKQHYNLYLTGTQAIQRVFQEICKKEVPDIVQHLEEKNCELTPITFNWFMTIFIDSLTVEVVLNIWDCFLVHGHVILYKFALCLLKLQRTEILKGKDSLSIMRSLKKFGKTFYDGESLLKGVSETTLSEPAEHYLSSYRMHVLDIQEDNDKRKREDDEYEKEREKLKFTPKTMMVSVSDNLDELNDDLIIKCAQCEENRNFVWLCCSSDMVGQIFILNVSSRRIFPISWQADSRCLAIERLPNLNVMLVSTMKSSIHAIDVEKREELWKMQLAGCVLSISCGPLGDVALSLMDGSVAFLNIQEKEYRHSNPAYIDVSRSPVFCGCIIKESYWCGAGNKIIVLDLRTLETIASLQVCPNDNHVVNKLVNSDYGIWNSLERCSVVHLWHKTKYYCLLTVDILDACGLSHEKKAPSSSSTVITTLLALKDKLWVGFGNGRFAICDICRESNPEDDLDEAFHIYKNSQENLTVIEHGNGHQHIKKSPSKGVTTCYHMIDDSRNSRLEQHIDDTTDFVVVDKRYSRVEDDDGMILSLNMSQIQRVSENQVNCFVLCRNDGKLILSCMGALSDDSSVILWSSEKKDGRQMWFAQTVSYSQ